jgi:periplasmic protein TonB
METNEILKASLDDLVFEGRNKAYGAYLLRRLYNRHITTATVVASVLFALLLSAPLIARLINGGDDTTEVVKHAKVVSLADLPPPPPTEVPPPPPPPPPVEPPPPPVRATQQFTPPVIKPDDEVVKEEIPDQDLLKTVDAGTKTQEGDPNAPVDLGVLEGTGIVEEVVETKPYTWVEQMPTFPGGDAEMMKYLGKNIRYPPVAQRNGLEGLVVLSFTVSSSGEISDIEVVKSLGGGTDEEAVRVVKGMPKWQPGKQNGRAVPVKFTLPIRFTIK